MILVCQDSWRRTCRWPGRGAGFAVCEAFLRVGAGGPWARTGSRGPGGAGQAGAGRSLQPGHHLGQQAMAGPEAAGSGAGRGGQPARDGDQPPPRGGDHGLAPRTPCPARMSSPAVRAVSWCSQAAMLAASSAPHIHAVLTCGIRTGGAAARCRACCRGTGSPRDCRADCTGRRTATPDGDASPGGR